MSETTLANQLCWILTSTNYECQQPWACSRVPPYFVLGHSACLQFSRSARAIPPMLTLPYLRSHLRACHLLVPVLSISGSTLKTAFASCTWTECTCTWAVPRHRSCTCMVCPWENICCCTVGVHGYRPFQSQTMRVYTSRHVFLGRSPHPEENECGHTQGYQLTRTHKLSKVHSG